jgi:hypothetical protein
MPCSCFNTWSSSQTRSSVSSSRLAVGSSKRSTFGWPISANAIKAFWNCPPDKVPMLAFNSSGARPTAAAALSTSVVGNFRTGVSRSAGR